MLLCLLVISLISYRNDFYSRTSSPFRYILSLSLIQVYKICRNANFSTTKSSPNCHTFQACSLHVAVDVATQSILLFASASLVRKEITWFRTVMKTGLRNWWSDVQEAQKLNLEEQKAANKSSIPRKTVFLFVKMLENAIVWLQKLREKVRRFSQYLIQPRVLFE